jgi:integrase/recombinase XerD
MDTSLILPDNQHSLATIDSGIPALFVHAGDKAAYRFIEFFTANIHNPNTRRAYYRAVTRFSHWCTRHGVELTKVNPVLVAKYVQELGAEMQPPTVK